MEEKEIKKILEKIQKLMALQKGAEAIGSLDEAANAAEKIQRLLLKYNLDMQDAQNFGKSPSTTQLFVDAVEGFGYNKREGLWIPQLAVISSEFFLCRTLNTRENGDGLIITFIGRLENIKVSIEATINLVSVIRFSGRQAWAKNKNSGELKGAFLRSYYAGAILGLRTKLREIKSRQEAEARANHGNISVNGSLLPMVMLNQMEKHVLSEADQFMRDNHEFKTKVHKARPTTEATVLGYERGKTLTPQTSLGSGENSGKLR